MKTAILYATRKGDAHAFKFLKHAPFSEVLAEFKERVANNRGVPGYDSIAIITGPPVKTAHRLASGDQEPAAILLADGEGPTLEQFQEIAQAWEAREAALRKRIEELEAELADLTTTFQGAPPQGAEGLDPEGSTHLPHEEPSGTGEGNLPGVSGDEASPGEASPGSMSPKGKKGK